MRGFVPRRSANGVDTSPSSGKEIWSTTPKESRFASQPPPASWSAARSAASMRPKESRPRARLPGSSRSLTWPTPMMTGIGWFTSYFCPPWDKTKLLYCQRSTATREHHDQRQPHLPWLHFAAPETALRRLGESRRPAIAADSRRPGSLPQLGLGGRPPAGRLARHGHGFARSRRPRLVTGRRLFDGRLCLRPGADYPSARTRTDHDRRPLPGREYRASLYRARSE